MRAITHEHDEHCPEEVHRSTRDVVGDLDGRSVRPGQLVVQVGGRLGGDRVLVKYVLLFVDEVARVHFMKRIRFVRQFALGDRSVGFDDQREFLEKDAEALESDRSSLSHHHL